MARDSGKGMDAGLAGELAVSAASMIPMVGPLLTPFVARLWSGVTEEWARRSSTALRLACGQSGLSPEELAEVIESDPQLVSLAARVLRVAAESGGDRTLKLLAGYLAVAVSDAARVDEAELMLTAIQGLSDPHVRVLERLGTAREGSSSPWEWLPHELEAASGLRAELVQVGVQGLVNAGFVSEVGVDGGDASGDRGGMVIRISPMGQVVLDVLRDYPAEGGA